MALINIICFGPLSDLMITTTCEANDLSSLKLQLEDTYPDIKKYTYNMAVNQRILTACLLNDNDTVALLPAYSGG
ncbi:MAG: MoaD/ThiS family protein [Bacteroidia bacterium]|nr:MoaD/ThiS family protein [Bacteroidia bacterium]